MLEHLGLLSPFPPPRRDPNPGNLYAPPPLGGDRGGGTGGGDRKCTAPPGNQKIDFAVLLAILVPCFFASFSRCLFGLILIDFPSQLGSRNTLKSFTNRCQEAFHLGFRFFIDLCLMFAPNVDQQITKNPAPAAARARFLKNRPSTSTLIFDLILVPTWLHFGAQNTPKPI